MLKRIMDEWVTEASKEPRTVKRLLTALNVPDFMDVKLRVEKLLESNVQDQC